MCLCVVGPQGWGPNPEKMGPEAPKGGEEGPKFCAFPLSHSIFALLVVSSRGILVVFEAPEPSNVHQHVGRHASDSCPAHLGSSALKRKTSTPCVMVAKLVEMAATLAGPVRQEEYNLQHF